MQSTLGLRTGQLVKSKSGRDIGRIFVILEILDEKYVLIADGDLRKIIKPKKKKVKHLVKYGACIDLNVKDFNDSYLRKELEVYRQKEEL